MNPGTANKYRWDRVAELFDRATMLPERERGRFLDQACAGEPDLHRELQGLLAAHARPGPIDDLREQLAADVDVAMPGEPDPCTHIGGYRVRERLGYGGMGVVYLADREGEGFQQRVAIKVLRAGLDAGSMVPRFLAERRILARLEHPNISRFVDGGLTEHGAPYFAMEYVEGTPLDAYCDRNRLTIEQRLTLFAAVCDAIHYAHQHLVVHRDLKPTNILVTREGVVKVLDFGIAKLLDAPDDALLTGAGQRWMTPDYASPEQVRGDTVTTAADVFVLGIVLYELLVGRRPHPGAVRHDVEQSILKTQPDRPSEAACEETCRVRGLAAAHCRRRLAGDLDTIMLKALSKAPARRYGTAGELADDLRRHLAGLPVRARPDTAVYRVRKFVARQRVLAAALAVTALSVVGGAVATAVAAQHARANATRAAMERDRAEQVSRFVVGLFAGVDPLRTAGAEVTARELLDSGAARLHRELIDQPASRAPLLEVLSRSYLGLGRYEDAQAAIAEAVAMRRASAPVDTMAMAGALADQARLFVLRSVPDSAGAPAREALALRRAVSAPAAALASELGVLGDVFSATGELDSAEFYLRAASAQLGVDADPGPRAEVIDNLAAVLMHRGRLAEVESLQVIALELRRRQWPPGHPEIALALTGLGGTRFRLGKLPQARADLISAVVMEERALGRHHPYVAYVYHMLGQVTEAQGDLPAAEAAFLSSAELKAGLPGQSGRTSLARTLGALGVLRVRRGDVRGAESLLTRSLEIRRAAFGDQHAEVAQAWNGLGVLYRATGRLGAAEALHRRALGVLRPRLPPQHLDLLGAEAALGATLAAQGRRAEADSILVRVRQALGTSLNETRAAFVRDQLDELERLRARPRS